MVGISVTVVAVLGATVKVCGAAEPLNVKVIGVLSPPPEGARVIVPAYA